MLIKCVRAPRSAHYFGCNYFTISQMMTKHTFDERGGGGGTPNHTSLVIDCFLCFPEMRSNCCWHFLHMCTHQSVMSFLCCKIQVIFFSTNAIDCNMFVAAPALKQKTNYIIRSTNTTSLLPVNLGFFTFIQYLHSMSACNRAQLLISFRTEKPRDR